MHFLAPWNTLKSSLAPTLVTQLPKMASTVHWVGGGITASKSSDSSLSPRPRFFSSFLNSRTIRFVFFCWTVTEFVVCKLSIDTLFLKLRYSEFTILSSEWSYLFCSHFCSRKFRVRMTTQSSLVHPPPPDNAVVVCILPPPLSFLIA